MSYMMPKYDTPFLTMAAQNIAQGLERQGANRQRQEMGMLAGKANMGDQMALQELYMYSPEMASQIQSSQEQAAQARQQAAMAEREKRRQRRLDFQGKYEEGLSKAFRAENYEDALEIMQQTVTPYADILDVEAIIRDRFTPSTFEAGRGVDFSGEGSGKKVQSSSDLGGGAVQILYKDGSTEVVTPTDEQRELIKIAQEQNISYESALNKARSFSRAEGSGLGKLSLAADMTAAKALEARAVAEAEGDVEKIQAADLAFERALGAEGGKIYSTAQSSAQEASRIIPNLNRLKKAVKNVDTSGWTPFATQFKRFFGMDVADEETLNAQLMGLAQDVLNQQTGTKTDFDFKVAAEQVASLGKTREANERLIDLLIQRNMDMMDYGNQVRNAYDSGGTKAVLDLRYVPEQEADLDAQFNEAGL